ncbi:MAG: nucleotidyl transferase AbiEii/AbiGii toxin family protein [Parafilimonas sp.]
MKVPELENFSLVGGTALALRYGHRKSIDLDLFSSEDFNNENIAAIIESNFPTFTYQRLNNPIGIFGFINNIKVDFVKHHYYPVIEKISETEGLRIISDKDIIAMKINAILRRAVKKDFWDLAELLQHYSLRECIDFYNTKFKNQFLLVSIPKAITYFDDAEESEDPVSLKNQTWNSVKKIIQKSVREYLE